MNKLTQYTSMTLLTAIIFIALSLTLVVWLTQILRFLELVVDAGAPIGIFFELLLLTIPRFLTVVLPFATVGGVLFIFHKFLVDNELVVMRAAGLSPWQIIKGAVGLSIFLGLLMFFLSGWVAPMSYAKVQELKQTITNKYSTFLLREGVFNSLDNQTTIYIQRREDGGRLKGLVIHKSTSPESSETQSKQPQAVTIIAEEGYLIQQEGSTQIVVNEGSQQQKDPQTGYVSRLDFDNYTIDVTPEKSEVASRFVKPSERTFVDLVTADMSERENARFKDAIFVEIHNRILSPFVLIAFTFMSLAALLYGEFDRRGQKKRIIMAVLLVTFLQSIFMSLLSLAQSQHGAIIALYLIVFASIGLSIAILQNWIRLDDFIYNFKKKYS
tara:strand:+ start:3234 stop:4385 length:1152 start_codon:yes stop_codon:yes gene_type:complete